MESTALNKVFQLGIVVEDARKAAEKFCQLFSIEPSQAQHLDLSKQAVPVRYKGKITKAFMKISMVQAAGVEFEFIQYVGGDANFHKDFFEQCGPGLQHICIATDSYDTTIEKMSASGAEILVEGGTEGNGYYKYMDCRKDMGLIFELYDETLWKNKVLAVEE